MCYAILLLSVLKSISPFFIQLQSVFFYIISHDVENYNPLKTEKRKFNSFIPFHWSVDLFFLEFFHKNS